MFKSIYIILLTDYRSAIEDTDDEVSDPLTGVPSMNSELRRVPLKPSIDETVGLTSPGYWSIGSRMFLRTCTYEKQVPPEIVCSWNDNGKIYYLQNRSPPRWGRNPEGNFKAGRHPDYYGIQRAIWNFSPNVFCKVKPWVEGQTTEATTIRFVNKNVPSIPTEEIIYDWIDPQWNRTIMISRRVTGITYQEAWPNLTTQQKLQVAEQVAEYFKALAKITSDHVETVEGSGLQGMYSLRVREALPIWKPRIEPRVPLKEYVAFITRCDQGIEPLNAREPLVLQHPDVSPTNLFVSMPCASEESPKVTAIIDWERVGYLFKWEVSTWPRINEGFEIETTPFCWDALDWQWMLSNACVRAGFPLYLDFLTRRATNRQKYKPHLPIEAFFNFQNLLD